jgi:hypothetical protein
LLADGHVVSVSKKDVFGIYPSSTGGPYIFYAR